MKHSLTDLPDLAMPAGYALRSMRPDELPAWAALLNRNAELGEWDLERAEEVFRGGERVPYAGCFFVTHDGEPVATAQLTLHRDTQYAPMPELGWVAVSPDHRGHGLGAAVSLAVLHHAATIGHREVFLLTDDHRLPALAIYLKLGFAPWLVDPTAEQRWHSVRQALGMT
jgi:mycothiol synthase